MIERDATTQRDLPKTRFFEYAGYPQRADLYRSFERSQRWSVAGEIVLWILLVVLFLAIDWSAAYRDALYSFLALAFVPLQAIAGVLMIFFKKKKKIEELSETARFGVFDKVLLRKTAEEVLDHLNIPRNKVAIFVTGDKQLNAFAACVGLSQFLPGLRGVYLHRQTLHFMNPQELKSWIGHELGHLFPFAIRWDQAVGLQWGVGALLGLFVLQTIGNFDGLGLLAVLGVTWLFYRLNSIPHQKMGQVVEYLCDECGCYVGGLQAAITDLVRSSRETAAHFHLLMYTQQLEAEGRLVSEKEAIRVYEEAIGYGITDLERTRQQIHEAIRSRREGQVGFSLRGLIDFMWRDPSQDSSTAQLRDAIDRQYRWLLNIPTIDWFQRQAWDGRTMLSMAQIEDLARTLQDNPHQLLVPLMEEVQFSTHTSHPSFRNRILYLWENRDAIFAEPVNRYALP